MAKPMTKSKIVAALAEKVEVPKKVSAAYLEALAAMAHKEAKNGFTIPGVGKLVVRSYKARMGRNPQTGEAIKIPRSEEHTSELQSQSNLVCRLLLEKKNKLMNDTT